ncbi:geranylgeranylglycerol-phosphate geranylgeranyltransferase [Methanococcoides alaskense]|uniref:Digeranylgeranylglyceryl phosphate synthase n=1 Tax=Methanococcoides alaskense TaxID=325778 RepID=A0AA90TZU8_9EURY|nr:geranylgeranylglycerol-phosphate geranylgeranyltransferase [Methanococcoides alaskense]MDA0524785.1 geranylgeranylglycerol-phosphate geranylgeranyltransferase [Methanococcoides alaskense]MDR6223092.1 geranylgeranylglycerol-phosphate geranylgeranyltransferase [Methanococcoides alaskense]
MKAYLELMRAGNCAMAAFAGFIGVLIAYNILSSASPYLSLSLFDTSLIFAIVFLVTGAGNGLNDYFDIEIDKVNKPSRPIPSGKISLKSALYFSLLLFITGIALAFLVNSLCGIIALFNSIILILYAQSLKRTPFFGNASVGYLTGSTFLFGGAVFGMSGLQALVVLFLLATLATIAREIVKDVEDIEGDKKDGARTLPILIGAKKASYIAAVFGFMAMLASPVPYLQSILNEKYLFVVAIADIFFLIAVYQILGKKDAAHSSKLFKFAMLFALISFIVGA